MSNSSFLKVVYFDESFVADFMQIVAGGKLKKTEEFIDEYNRDLSASAGVAGSIGTGKTGLMKVFSFLSGASLKAEGDASVEFSKKRDRITKNILENTLLSDFISLMDADSRKTKNKKCRGIEVFRDVAVRPEKNSFTYMMLIAPYLNMVSGEIPVENQSQSFSIDLNKVEQAMEKGRGYYEFICDVNNKEIILRFNYMAFRNNYTMSDLPKMSLTYYAIRVGEIEKNALNVQREFEFGTFNASERIEYSERKATTDIKLPVYDVVLAGVLE